MRKMPANHGCVQTSTSPSCCGMKPSFGAQAIVPMMGRLAATGVGAGVFAAGVAVGLAWNVAVNMYAERFNARLASSLPICVVNCSDKEVQLQIRSAGMGELVQYVRAYCGAGCRMLVLAPGAAGQLKPPCEAACSHFLYAFTAKKQQETMEVHRGDVIMYTDKGFQVL
ncbi:unnamed protein product [Effrenium voratum]|nr:unnamed protein product [Effrenium voratum]